MLKGIEQLISFLEENGAFSSSDISDVKKKLDDSMETFKDLNFCIYPTSLDRADDNLYFMINQDGDRRFISLARGENNDNFEAAKTAKANGYTAKICDLSPENTAILREAFSYTRPKVLGTQPAFGTGDRIGGMASATPGHVRAAKDYDVAMFFAQQSVRENERTRRTPQEVVDDACWGVFQEGYKRPWGADADHLMEFSDMEKAVQTGYTMFTVDPSHSINNEAVDMEGRELKEEFQKLFENQGDAEDFVKKYTSIEEDWTEGGHSLRITYSEEDVMRIGLQYLKAIDHTVRSYNLIAERMGNKRFDFEMSIDETERPTTAQAHYLISRELKERGVRLTSIAPRFDAGFEKGVDIRTNDGRKPTDADLKQFEDNVKDHALIAKKMGPYKLCVHSGSDKFTAYPIVSRHTQGMFHVKTAGTSYLEAVKVVAKHDRDLYAGMHKLALDTLDKNRATYHLTLNLANVPKPEKLKEFDLVEGLTNNDDWRQVIHVAYGVLLDNFKDRMFATLEKYSEDHYKTVETHIRKHLDTYGLSKVS